MVNRIAHLFPTPMTRPSHPKKQLATTIPPALHECVRDFSEASGVPIAQIVEDALRKYLRSLYWPTDLDVPPAVEGDEWRGGEHG